MSADPIRDAIADTLADPEHMAEDVLAAVPDDSDPRTIGERLADGATAERLVRDLLPVPNGQVNVVLGADDRWVRVVRFGMGTDRGPKGVEVRAVDPEAADLLARLTGADDA